MAALRPAAAASAEDSCAIEQTRVLDGVRVVVLEVCESAECPNRSRAG